MIRCPLCGAGPERNVAVSSKGRGGDALRSVACTVCGLVFSNPMPAAAALDAFYRRQYRLEYKRSARPQPRRILRAFRLARHRLDGLLPHLPATGRALDLGAGGGEWVRTLCLLGLDAEGIEPGAEFALYAAEEYGVRITPAPSDAIAFDDGAFDLVTAFHVFEHLRDPGSAFDRVHALLRPGGRFVVEVPDIASDWQSNASKFHFAHVIGFTADTLRALGGRHGFSVVADLTGRLNAVAVALVFARSDAAATGDLPSASSVERTIAALRRRTLLHRGTVAGSLRKFTRSFEERWTTRGLTGRQIGDRVIGEALTRLGLTPPAALR